MSKNRQLKVLSFKLKVVLSNSKNVLKPQNSRSMRRTYRKCPTTICLNAWKRITSPQRYRQVKWKCHWSLRTKSSILRIKSRKRQKKTASSLSLHLILSWKISNSNKRKERSVLKNFKTALRTKRNQFNAGLNAKNVTKILLKLLLMRTRIVPN